MNVPQVNLGQSQFQDTYFVAQAQLSPYRQLRSIQLELMNLEDALKRQSFKERRLKLEIEKLDPLDPMQAIDIEEKQWDLQQLDGMVQDAKARRDNFLRLRDELLSGVPAEYWEQGFENAELDHWVQYIAQDIAIMRITGQININSMKQLAMLPEGAAQACLALSNEKAARLALPPAQTFPDQNSPGGLAHFTEAQVLPVPTPAESRASGS